MKKVFKSRMFSFILGAVIFGFVGAVSAYSLFANNVGFTPSDATWKKTNGDDITNVEDAINELYIDANKDIFEKIDLTTESDIFYALRDVNERKVSLNLQKGKYLVLFVVGMAANTNGTVTNGITHSQTIPFSAENATCTDVINDRVRVKYTTNNLLGETGTNMKKCTVENSGKVEFSITTGSSASWHDTFMLYSIKLQ